MSQSLYEINQQLLEAIDLSTGEIVDEAAYNALQLERTEKLEGIALWHKNLLAQAEALKAEEKAFSDRRKSAESKAAYLKDLLARELNGQKFETVKAKIGWRKSTVVAVDEDKLPPQYLLSETVYSVDKNELKELLKRGETIPGAELVENNNISIK